MTRYADAIRRAVLAAARLHRDLGTQASAPRENGLVDVFESVARLNVPLILRPLDGLLGAYFRDPSPGVLVTTQRQRSVQRFTAAHELGHHILGHDPSLDDESILRRTPFTAHRGDHLQEVEADAFAAAFLLPRWLVAWHGARQGWVTRDLQRPEIVYQLALRVGMSYEATCWTLNRYKLLTPATAAALAAISPKKIKQEILGEVRPKNYYGDVWILTERDAGFQIEGGPEDLFVMRLREQSGSGFLWDTGQIDRERLLILGDTREDHESGDVVGSPSIRRITTQSRERQSGETRLVERRPWDPTNPLQSFAVRYDLVGSEGEGWSRAERRYRLEAA